MDWFDVMHRFENGDPCAFAQLNELIRGKLSRMRRQRQLDCAEDVVQEILISLLRAWRRGCIREARCFEGFVWRLAERRLVDAWNRQTRPGDPDCVGDPELAICAEHALSSERQREQAVDLTRALEQLSNLDRSALRAIYFEGQTYVEAAETLGMPLGTLKRKLGTGLKRMRATLA